MATPDVAPVTITDAAGRKIVLRVLDPADMLDLLEAAGAASTNAGWVRYASVIASVSSIGDVPVPLARRKADILTVARKLGNEGFAAVGEYLYGKPATGDETDAPAAPATEELAKN